MWTMMLGALLTYLGAFYGQVPQLSTVEDFLLRSNVESRSVFRWFVASIGLELLVEPIFVQSQYLAQFQVRLRVEGLALFAKCMVMCAHLMMQRQRNVEIVKSTIEWAFVYSELAYAGCLFLGYLAWNWSSGRSAEENSTKNQKVGPPQHQSKLKMFLSFYVYDIFRFILTEGEKYALVWFSTLKERGVYDVVFNLGSLVVRLVFQPIEQVAFTTWVRMLHPQNMSNSKEDKDKKKRQLDEALFFLRGLLKLMMMIALTFACFGPSYSHTLFQILYGLAWAQTEAPFLMQVYCIYVGIVALNGVSEAFVRAAATGKTLQSYSLFMTLFSVIYVSVCSSLTFMGMGTVALILSNCVNMLCRIIYNAVFIRRYFGDRGRQFRLQDVLPRPLVLLCFFGSLIVCKSLELPLRNARLFGVPGYVLHVGIGALCFFTTFGMLWYQERNYLRELKSYFG